MSNTEKLIKQLNENKEIRKQKEKVIKPAVRIQQVKNNLIILAHDLLVSKKINDSLYRKIQLLTYSKTTEKKLNESYDTLKKLKTTVRKSEELQGPVKTKKITVKDFKKETNNNKEVSNNTNKVAVKAYEIDFPLYTFFKDPTASQLHEASEHFLKVKEYKRGANKDYIPIEKTEHTRKKTFIYDFNGITKILSNYLLNIYNQQKFTFKLTIEFSFLLINVDYTYYQEYVKNKSISVEFDLRLASTNSRPDAFKNPVVVDNKKDINNIIKTLTNVDLIEQFTKQRKDSKWKFYKFLDVKFHVYEMNTPIGKINKLPDHFKEGSK